MPIRELPSPPWTHSRVSSLKLSMPTSTAMLIVANTKLSSVQFSLVQFLNQLGCRGNMTDDSAEILIQSFLQEAPASESGMDRDVRSSMLSTQSFLRRPWRRPPSQVPRRMCFGEAVVACDMQEKLDCEHATKASKRVSSVWVQRWPLGNVKGNQSNVIENEWLNYFPGCRYFPAVVQA